MHDAVIIVLIIKSDLRAANIFSYIKQILRDIGITNVWYI